MSVEIISQISFPGSSLGPHIMDLFSSFATFIFCFKFMSFNFTFPPLPHFVISSLFVAFLVLHFPCETVPDVFPFASIDQAMLDHFNQNH